MNTDADNIAFLNKAAGIDKHLEFIMRELEHCDDMLYNENLSAANFIYWQTRKEAFKEIRDDYCEFKKSRNE